MTFKMGRHQGRERPSSPLLRNELEAIPPQTTRTFFHRFHASSVIVVACRKRNLQLRTILSQSDLGHTSYVDGPDQSAAKAFYGPASIVDTITISQEYYSPYWHTNCSRVKYVCSMAFSLIPLPNNTVEHAVVPIYPPISDVGSRGIAFRSKTLPQNRQCL